MTRLELSHLPLDRIFAVFDADNSGRLDYKEFLLGVSKLRLKGEQAIKCTCPHLTHPTSLITLVLFPCIAS
jgi:hypothetical protein